MAADQRLLSGGGGGRWGIRMKLLGLPLLAPLLKAFLLLRKQPHLTPSINLKAALFDAWTIYRISRPTLCDKTKPP